VHFCRGQVAIAAAAVFCAQASGVRVKVEKDVRPGSKVLYRKLVLSGSVDAVQVINPWLA
jgi:hypothetical protein